MREKIPQEQKLLIVDATLLTIQKFAFRAQQN
jgi:hypothetical protein